jgi:hypothetical protein
VAEKTLGPVVAALAFLAGGACAVHQPGAKNGPPADVDTPIILFADTDEPCAVSVKQSSVTSHPDKWLKFEITNHCTSQQTVRVGNFRTTETPSPAPANCDAAMHGGADPIFQQDDVNRRTAVVPAGTPGNPKYGEIKLKLKKATELPGSGTLTYYYDVCLNGPISKDPRLIIQR